MSQDNVHSLIQGLTGNEKRFFKLFAQNGIGRKNRNYLQLFDLLAAMDHYDRDTLQEQLLGTPIYGYLNSTKSRLGELILKSLRIKEEKKNINGQLKARLANIDLLLGRNLFAYAAIKINQSRKLAAEYERYKYQLELLDAEIKLFVQQKTGDHLRFFEEHHQEREICLDLLYQKSTLEAIHARIRTVSKQITYVHSNASTLDPVARIMQHPLLQSAPSSDSLLTHSLHQNCWGIYYLRIGEYDSAFKVYKPLMKRWEKKIKMRASDSDLYLGIVNNYLSSIIFSLDHSTDFLKSIRGLRKLEGLSPNEQLKLQRISYLHEFNYQMNYGTYDQGKSLSEEISSWMTTHHAWLPPNRVLHFELNMSVFFFAFGDFQRSNTHLKNIIHHPGRAEREDIRDFAPLLRLLVQYELGNLGESADMIRSADRNLKRGDKLQEYEQALLWYIRAIQRVPFDTYQQQAVAEELELRLTNLEAASSQHPIGLGVIKVWVQSKTSGMTIRARTEELIQEHLSQKNPSNIPP